MYRMTTFVNGEITETKNFNTYTEIRKYIMGNDKIIMGLIDFATVMHVLERKPSIGCKAGNVRYFFERVV